MDEFVERGYFDLVYDIGTDHAYLPIWMIRHQICKKVVATDIKAGPLHKAAKNIRAADCESQIVLEKGDGIDAIQDFEPGKPVMITGMGSTTITQIIEKDLERAKRAECIILQPMNSQEILRKWLNENGFRICFEKLAVEDRRVYSVLFCKWTGEQVEYSQEAYFIGKRFKNCSQECFLKYLDFVKKKVTNRLKGLESSKQFSEGVEIQLLNRVVRLIESERLAAEQRADLNTSSDFTLGWNKE